MSLSKASVFLSVCGRFAYLHWRTKTGRQFFSWSVTFEGRSLTSNPLLAEGRSTSRPLNTCQQRIVDCCMPISIETIQEFQQTVERVYGERLSISQAREILNSLTSYFSLLGKIKMRGIAKDHEQEQ